MRRKDELWAMTSKQIIVIVGPSGSGKTSIGKVLTKQGIPPLVTTTTREPRPGEVDGEDYYFRNFSTLDRSEFVEQTTYNGNRYGLTKKEVNAMLTKHDIVHVSLDQSGAEAVKAAYPEETCVVFVTISEEEMVRRMKIRGDTNKEIKARVAYSRKTDELVPPEITDLVIENIEVESSAHEIIEKVVEK